MRLDLACLVQRESLSQTFLVEAGGQAPLVHMKRRGGANPESYVVEAGSGEWRNEREPMVDAGVGRTPPGLEPWNPGTFD